MVVYALIFKELAHKSLVIIIKVELLGTQVRLNWLGVILNVKEPQFLLVVMVNEQVVLTRSLQMHSKIFFLGIFLSRLKISEVVQLVVPLSHHLVLIFEQDLLGACLIKDFGVLPHPWSVSFTNHQLLRIAQFFLDGGMMDDSNLDASERDLVRLIKSYNGNYLSRVF